MEPINARVFKDAEDFVNFTNGDPYIISQLPWAQDIINHHQAVNVGCGCRRDVRVGNRDKIYESLIVNLLAEDVMSQAMIKMLTGHEKVIFKNGETTLLEI